MTDRTLDIGEAIETQAGSGFARTVLWLCCAIMVIEGYDVQLLAYAAPAIIRDWKLDKALFGPVLSAALFGYMVGGIALTSLGDRFGRKRVIAGGMLLFGALTVATAFVHDLQSLTGLRFLAGLGLGCSIPATVALGVEYSPRSKQAWRVSLLFVGYTLGGAIGGIIAAYLIVHFGWPSAFLFGGFASLLLVATLVLALPESPRFLALSGAEAALAKLMKKLRPDLPITAETRFVLREEGKARMPVAGLFADGRVGLTLLLWFAFITSLTGHYFLSSWLPTVLASNGLPLAHAVIAGSLLQGGGALGSLIVGGLLDRRGLMMVAGAYALAIPFTILIGAPGLSELLLMGSIFIAGLFLLGGQVALNALAGTLYPTFMRTTGAGWALGIGRIGSILGPLVGGILIGMHLSTPMLFVSAAIPMAACGLAVLALRGFIRAGSASAAAPTPPLDVPETAA